MKNNPWRRWCPNRFKSHYDKSEQDFYLFTRYTKLIPMMRSQEKKIKLALLFGGENYV